jgi:LAS superfamily LD-carboxypeptidase LdcB
MELQEAGCALQPEAARAYLALQSAALRDGLAVAAASSFRPFERQLAIWNDKFLGRRPLLDRHGRALEHASLAEAQIVQAILQWSALPGASRHHWGTEIDVFDRNTLRTGQPQLVAAEFAPGGAFSALEQWLQQHAGRFGFFRPYDRDRGGVAPEPWHLSFAPVSAQALQALTLEVLDEALSGVDLAGASVVRLQLPDIYERYVLAVAAPPSQALAAGGTSAG